MNSKLIEGKCKCGKCGWDDGAGGWGCYHPNGAIAEKRDPWVNYIVRKGYCPNCGWKLSDDGWAYPTVVVPEEPIVVYLGSFAGVDYYRDVDETGYGAEWMVVPLNEKAAHWHDEIAKEANQ